MYLKRVLVPLFCLGLEVLAPVVADQVEIREVAADKGTNVTIPCGDLQENTSNVQWVHRGNRTHHTVLMDGGLLLRQVGVEDEGLYECGVENETAYVDRVNLTVRTEPPPLVNVTVHASTILALILWNVAGDGGHPIIDFTAQYRSAAPVNNTLEPWRPISPNHISPNSRQVDVYHLEPNASYWFRVWATNALGPGPPVEVLATTLYSDQEAELYKHFLEGAESFDTRTWLAAVCVVMGTLAVLAAGTCAVLCREWRRPEYEEEQDIIELVPNIILNPGFMETDPVRPRESYAASIIKSTECPGPGKPRRV
ncbi:PREDICTED: Down syndrome cell adhesion molecule-like protein 1 homolog isoform X1 [Papilio xuthus]|uniref:Down syndrome cell adhesion molecule-like protein 1 homolog isoform X1 n=1 Tax=Papilio xuthus TaxID=66420 RepID=A0AAJ6ZDH8_PAPXU|nr:PREDICTED: Down syndrome cell adhesion molecule-like protein 1 homolog isoform X1 [Papilio xuthus]